MPNVAPIVEGMRVSVEVPDSEWASTLEQLWEPFLTRDADASATFKVTHNGDGWRVHTPDGSTHDEPHEWAAADRLRYEVTELALSKSHIGFIDLHAGAVARGQTLLLVAGAPGSGKTSVTLQLVDAGWTFLCDDVVRIERETGAVRPVPKPMGIKNLDRWNQLAARWDAPKWERHARGNVLAPSTVFPRTEYPPPTSASALLFPAFEKGKATEVKPLSPAQATARCAELIRGADEQAISCLARICSAAASAELVYDRDASVASVVSAWALD